MSHRVERVNSLIRQELSELLRREIKDPRLSGMISITQVETAPDLKFAKVFVSSLGGLAEQDEVLSGLTRAAGATDTPVIASGGVASLDDVAALAAIPGLGGIIVGKALYERRFTVAEAVAVLGR